MAILLINNFREALTTDNRHGIKITGRDRVLRAWECSMELVRDFQAYSDELEADEQLSKMFSEYAEDEARHASALLEILQHYESEQKN
ncbi:MAG: rubrerythrin [Clostridiales bacterium]|nr:rubrerythrin [Clostridiales bacterium]